MAVICLHELGPFLKGAFNLPDKFLTALRCAPHGYDGVAFGVVIGYNESFAVAFQAKSSAFNEIVSSFAFAGENYFQRIGRYAIRRIFWGTGAIKKESYGSVDAVGVLREYMYERFARACGMAWLVRGNVTPSVQETVPVYQYSHDGHGIVSRRERPNVEGFSVGRFFGKVRHAAL